MGRAIDLTGRRIGRLTVIRFSHRAKQRRFWVALCDCGQEIVAQGGNLLSGKSSSCGCNRGGKIKHGYRHTATYSGWCAMIKRCSNPKDAHYDIYGGRGITVCERWHKFENFLADMGERPDGKTLDRINTDGNYEPGNCRWATPTEQARNKRGNVLITINGETKTVREWSHIAAIGHSTIHKRIKAGWPNHRLLEKPRRAVA